jgi:glyoxylase-like metal-dependent hydrolase (beta-lactamase superfamily II)
MKKITIGDVEIIALTDGAGLMLPLDQTFPTVRAAQWEPYYQRYPQVFADSSTWYLHYGCYVVRTREHTLLVDTGVGPGPYMGVVYGRLPDVLSENDIDPKDVNTVFLTHAHSDHIGWNFTAEGVPMFSNARYMLHHVDWDFYQQPAVKMSIAPYVDRMLTPLKKLGILDLLLDGQSLTQEVIAIPTPGHSPGHMSLLISSKDQKALIGGDAIIHPAQVTEPGWCSVYDMDNGPAIATRRHLLDMLEAEEIVLAAGHFPSPGFGRITRQDGRRYWEAL